MLQLPEEWRLSLCNSSTRSTCWTTTSRSAVTLPAARISAASKTRRAPLSKWAQKHLRERKPGAAAYRLMETPVAKSLIFHPYSLNISLWRAVLLCVELSRHRGQTTKQPSAVVKRLGNQQKKLSPHQENMKKTWMVKGSLSHILHESDWSPFPFLLSLCCVHHAYGDDHPSLKGVKVKTWQQELSLTLHLVCNTRNRKTGEQLLSTR